MVFLVFRKTNFLLHFRVKKLEKKVKNLISADFDEIYTQIVFDHANG